MGNSPVAAPAFYETYGGGPAANYERYFVPTIGRPLAGDLVEAAKLRPGERILDVACGTGIVARLAAARVMPGGTVSALDINPAMLAAARAAAADAQPGIRWYESSAEAMPLPDRSFDVVLCQLGLQFMADRAAALREMHRVLAAGGQAFISTAGPSPFFDALHDVLEKYAGAAAAGFISTVFSLHRVPELVQELRHVGFHNVEGNARHRALHLPDPVSFLWQYLHSTPLAGATAALTSEERTAMERDLVPRWRPWTSGDGMHHQQPIITFSGGK